MYERKYGDDLLRKDKRLKYKWKWSRVASQITEEEIKKWTHFQVSECERGNWTLEAVQWGSELPYYEAVIRYGSSRMAAIGGSRETGFKTRIEAQIAAEKLLNDWITEQCNLTNK